jgi:hypothetical protein
MRLMAKLPMSLRGLVSVFLSAGGLGAFSACGAIAVEPSPGDGIGLDAGVAPPAPIAIVDAAPPPEPVDAPAIVPPAGGLDGVCTAGDVTLGFYDPDCVYALVSTSSTYGHDVLMDPAAPWRRAYGFGFYPYTFGIRASDRRLVLTTLYPATAYVFSPGLPDEGDKAYARNTVLPTPGCTQSDLRRVLLNPDKPSGIYECIQGGSRYYVLGTSTLVDVGTHRYVLALGESDVMLARNLGGPLVVLDNGVASDVIGIDGGKVVTVRSRVGGGFLVAAVAPSPGGSTTPRLYEVANDGTSKDMGAYHMGSIQLSATTALEPSGAMIGVVTLMAPFDRGVVRLRLDAVPEVIFDAGLQSNKELQIKELVTGP